MLEISRKSGSQDSSLLGRYTVATGKQLPTFRNVIVPSSSNSPRKVGLSSGVPRTYLTLETNTSFEISEHVTYSLQIATSQKTRNLCAMCYCVISIHLTCHNTVPTDRGTTNDTSFNHSSKTASKAKTRRTRSTSQVTNFN
jgi:hypothetical protein